MAEPVSSEEGERPPEPDIQEDFCIQLDGYPLLTKFSTQHDYTEQPFIEKFVTLVPSGIYFHFRIQVNSDGGLYVTPILNSVHSNIQDNYKANLEFFSKYISFQLANSGTLPALIDVLNLGKQLSIALRVIGKPRRDFSPSFFSFHKDQSIFTILQYYNFKQSFVFGTEVLLGYKEDETLLPHELGPLLPDKIGILSDAYRKISKVNDDLKEKGINPVVLRGKYNNGDTMVFSDPLLRHATITSKEIIESNAMKITLPKKGTISSFNVRNESVRICSEREKTTDEMVDNRQAIAIFIFLDTSDYTHEKPENLGEPFNVEVIQVTPLKTVNFDEEKFKDFIEILSSGNGCFTIDGLQIKSKGGKHKRTKTLKHKKKNKKQKSRRRRRRV